MFAVLAESWRQGGGQTADRSQGADTTRCPHHEFMRMACRTSCLTARTSVGLETMFSVERPLVRVLVGSRPQEKELHHC